MSNKMKRRALAVAVIAALNALLIALAQTAHADLYKRGSSGQRVTEIQTRLKNWGYYDGAVDGVYGSRTEAAVRWFQRQNGLSTDGQAGPQTLAALGLPTGESGAPQDSSGDVYLLAVNAQDRADEAALVLSEEVAVIASEFGPDAKLDGGRRVCIALGPNQSAMYRISRETRAN